MPLVKFSSYRYLAHVLLSPMKNENITEESDSVCLILATATLEHWIIYHCS